MVVECKEKGSVDKFGCLDLGIKGSPLKDIPTSFEIISNA